MPGLPTVSTYQEPGEAPHFTVMFAQLRRRLVRVLPILQALCILHTSCTKGAGAIPAAHMQFEAELFSPDWVEEFAADEVGCVKARGLYTWRRSGFGSNINSEYGQGYGKGVGPFWGLFWR